MKRLNGRVLIIIGVLLVTLIVFLIVSRLQKEKPSQKNNKPTTKPEVESQMETFEEKYGWIDSDGTTYDRPITEEEVIQSSNNPSQSATRLKQIEDIICEGQYTASVFILTETSYNKVYSLLRSDGVIWSIVYNKDNNTYFYTNDDSPDIDTYREYIDSTWDYDLYHGNYCEYIYAVLQDDGETLKIIEKSDKMKSVQELSSEGE